MHLATCIDMRVFRCLDAFGVRAAPGPNGCHGLQGLATLSAPAVVDRARAQGWIWWDEQISADADEPAAKRAKRPRKGRRRPGTEPDPELMDTTDGSDVRCRYRPLPK